MNGLVTTEFNGGYDFGIGLTMQSNGKILVAGGGLKARNAEFLLVRYNSDGTLDTSFSGDGKLITDFGVNIAVAGSVIVQSDQKILVAGQIFDGVSTFSLALARYNVDGSLDTTFGGGDGKVTGAVCASQVTVLSDGKILVVGTTAGDMALACYNANGSVDTTFGGGDGLVTINPGGGGKGEGVSVQSDGKILVSGWNGTNTDFVLARFTANGIFDGIVTTDFNNGEDRARCIALYNGKIIVAGFSLSGTNNNFAVVRYNDDGSLDISFSGDGKLISDLGGIDQGYCMVVQSDGKILVAGHSDNSLALVRYNNDGSLDSTFSSDGIVITNIGSLLATNEKSEILVGMGITQQSDGKILVTGQSSGDLALIRYNIDGSIDTSFGVSDVTAPIVNTFTPADGGINVAVDHNVMVNFSESIQRGVGTIAIHSGSAAGTVVESYNAATSTNLAISGSTLTINPTENLLNSSHYYVTFSAGSVKDLVGNSYAGTTSYDFTTVAPPDTTAPTVSAFTPADGGTGVAVGNNIVVDFSESIQRGFGIIAIHRGSADGIIVESYNAATSTNLSFTGSTLTINPTENLLYSSHYYVTFSAGSVKDLVDKNYAGSTSYDFTTEDIPLIPMLRNGISVMPERYSGPATGAGGAPLHFQFVGDSTGEVVFGTPYNDFINVGDGMDAVDAGAGNDVIDGGLGSNFLTGGAGTDIFFSDGRGGGMTWSTITDWQVGEQLSVWGWHLGTSKIVEWTWAGAAGYEGLTMHADLNGDGQVDTLVTFTGIISQSQLPTPLEFDGVLWFV